MIHDVNEDTAVEEKQVTAILEKDEVKAMLHTLRPPERLGYTCRCETLPLFAGRQYLGATVPLRI